MSDSFEKKNILLLLPYGSVGGMERLALTFYEYYRSVGHNVKAVKFIKLKSDIINFGDDELFLSTQDFNGMSSWSRNTFYLKAPRKIRKIIKDLEITHSIAFGDMANLFSSLTFTKEYKIGSIHALKSVELSSPTTFNKLVSLGYRSSYKHLNKLVCISKSINKDLKENCGYRFDNLEVIYNPHNIERLVSLSNEEIEDEWERDLFNAETVLFLGRLSVQKSPWHLIHAFKILTETRPDAKLIFIGDGDQQVLNYIKTLSKKLDLDKKIIFLGRKNNPYKYLKKAGCLALTSNYEGTPNVIVESIALGTPTVSSYCTAGILELMTVNDSVIYDDKSLLNVEAGIITPNFYEGDLDIPKSYNQSPSQKQELFAEALERILKKNAEGKKVVEKRADLLEKFDLVNIATQYLKI
ncbi:MAG: glycosyltransferase [Leeuwenhoekiella sp.]